MAKRKMFDDLRQALGDALAYERGQKIDLRVTDIPAPAKMIRPSEIRAIRRSMNASQVKFARLLNVSANTVESWEQGARRPRQAALKLLTIARKRPEVLLEA
jgi:putative transcriptional regulator